MNRDPESVLRGFYNVMNGANSNDLAEFFAPNYVEHPEEIHGLQAFAERLRMFQSAFPDLHVTVEEVLVDGNRASTRTRTTGTQTGGLMSIPATGRSIDVLGVDLVHFENGKATERWGGLDTFSLMQQLGVIPRAEQV